MDTLSAAWMAAYGVSAMCVGAVLTGCLMLMTSELRANAAGWYGGGNRYLLLMMSMAVLVAAFYFTVLVPQLVQGW